jgi:hypothetical protein
LISIAWGINKMTFCLIKFFVFYGVSLDALLARLSIVEISINEAPPPGPKLPASTTIKSSLFIVPSFSKMLVSI